MSAKSKCAGELELYKKSVLFFAFKKLKILHLFKYYCVFLLNL